MADKKDSKKWDKAAKIVTMPAPYRAMNVWLVLWRRLWSVHVDALQRYLDQMDQS